MLNLRLTQCMPNDKATAFALILEGNISESRRAGTGPAPSEKDKTYLCRIELKSNLENI